MRRIFLVRATSLLANVACLSLNNAMHGSTPASRLLHDDTFRRLCRARDLLAAEYQSQVPLDQAAREACLSPFHFHRLFRATFGETPHDFLTRMRMDRARR